MQGLGEPEAHARPSWIGRLIAQRYRLIGRLGEGTMADVYLARHVLIDRLSAIKVLRPDFGGDFTIRKRFLQEAKAVNRINHPNIVEITDYGEVDETAYLVMEYVPGEALARLLAQAPLGHARSIQLGLQVASALSRAHEMGVIHRDLTPANVLVVPRRRGPDLVKLTDFGVAKMLQAGMGLTGMTITGPSDAQFNPGYLAPEMATLGAIDPRSDLYSLGVMLFESTCGSLPFPARPDRNQRPSVEPAPRLTDLVPDVPRLFVEVVATLLAVDPDDRPRDAFETFEMLRRAAEETDAPVSRGSIASLSRPSDPRPKRSGPHLLTVSFDRIGPLCSRTWRRLLDALGIQERGPIGEASGIDRETKAVLDPCDRLVRMVEGLARIVESDARALAVVEERGRAFRAQLGGELDLVGKERSRSLGWAGTIAERHDYVKTQRNSGAHPIPESEAMLWEQAALEREEERAYAAAEDLHARFDSLTRKLDRANEALDHELAILSAQLDGHIAALRSLAVEAWLSLEQVAQTLEVDLGDAETVEGPAVLPPEAIPSAPGEPRKVAG